MRLSYGDLFKAYFGKGHFWDRGWKHKLWRLFQRKGYLARRSRILWRQSVHRAKRLLRQEMGKRDYLLKNIEKDDSWQGSYLVVPFKDET